MSQIALVTGANRGIGLEVTRQLAEAGYTVILGSRDVAKGTQAATALNAGAAVIPKPLDVADAASVEALRVWVEATFGRLDVLINNAAVNYDTYQNVLSADLDNVRDTFDTNTLGAWRLAQAFVPLLQKSEHGRLVNVSSGSGILENLSGGTPAYSVSKVALNALTLMLAAHLRGTKILVNAVDPGWTATDMGGGGRPVAEGAKSVLWAATLPDDGPSGGFFYDGERASW